MKKLISNIKRQWMLKVRFAQLAIGEPAPLEVMNTEPTLIHRDCAMRYYHMILEEVNEYREAIQDGNLTDEDRLTLLTDALGDIAYILIQMIVSHGLDSKFLDVLNEIHRSNLTKIQGEDIVMNEIGKILKPLDYQKPNLKDILK